MNRDYCIVIDNGGNVYRIKQQAITKCFDKMRKVYDDSKMKLHH